MSNKNNDNNDMVIDVDPNNATGSDRGTKRKIDEAFITIDPDSKAKIVSSKRTQYEPDNSKKIKVLKALIKGHDKIMEMLIALEPTTVVQTLMRTDLMVSNQIASIIFSTHNKLRQMAMGKVEKNLITKSSGTDLTVTFQDKNYSIKRTEIDAAWKAITSEVGLQYIRFETNNNSNWYGKMGPFLNICGAFGLRYTELRLGHNGFPVKKKDGLTTMNNVSSYGLNGAHHVLLEGITFAPERKSSMAQSLGPMAILIGMIRTEEEYRRKMEVAFKKAFLHIPHVDDVIELVRTRKSASDLAPLVGVLGDLILITSARQNNRMCFPLSMMSYAQKQFGDIWYENVNFSGVGGYLTYNKCREVQWSIGGGMTPEEAKQVIFHCIFGTYKEFIVLTAACVIKNT